MERKTSPLQEKIYTIIFKVDTPAGKAFDIALLITILASVLVVMLESIEWLSNVYHNIFYTLEWVFTIFFTLEYILRLYCVKEPKRYIFSFYGIIDLLAILPTYLSLVIANTQYLLIIRALRLLRVFRVFKLAHFMKESAVIIKALRASSRRIFIFLFFILLLVTVFGSIMYLVEGGANDQFDSIPRSIYWAIVTLTTVGYGDISPITTFGQLLASIVMILGYAVIAVPTGIVSSEMIKVGREMQYKKIQKCEKCNNTEHDKDAVYCKKCGEMLTKEEE
jgi:voltage-gated potassium channel